MAENTPASAAHTSIHLAAAATPATCSPLAVGTFQTFFFIFTSQRSVTRRPPVDEIADRTALKILAVGVCGLRVGVGG